MYWPSRRLGAAEERGLLRAAQNGNEEARNELVINNMPFVVFQAKRMNMKGSYLDLDDLVSVGALALIRSVNKFDLERENLFIAYAKWYIIDSMQTALRHARSQELSDLETTLHITAKSCYKENIQSQELYDAIDTLPTESASIVRLVLARHHQIDIGKFLGIYRGTVRIRYQQAVKLLKAWL